MCLGWISPIPALLGEGAGTFDPQGGGRRTVEGTNQERSTDITRLRRRVVTSRSPRELPKSTPLCARTVGGSAAGVGAVGDGVAFPGLDPEPLATGGAGADLRWQGSGAGVRGPDAHHPNCRSGGRQALRGAVAGGVSRAPPARSAGSCERALRPSGRGAWARPGWSSGSWTPPTCPPGPPVPRKKDVQLRQSAEAASRAALDAATSPADGEARLRQLVTELERPYPTAAACLAEDLPALCAHLDYPLRLRKRLRSTNLLERSLEEVKRRTKVIGRFPARPVASASAGRSSTCSSPALGDSHSRHSSTVSWPRCELPGRPRHRRG
jgi:hypothetical protein